jgi:hypothetical protein
MDSTPNLSLNTITYPSIRPFHSGHVTTQSRKISATVPRRSKLPTADSSAEETFLPPDGFLTELDPQVRLLTLPNFGVNNIGMWCNGANTFCCTFKHLWRLAVLIPLGLNLQRVNNDRDVQSMCHVLHPSHKECPFESINLVPQRVSSHPIINHI